MVEFVCQGVKCNILRIVYNRRTYRCLFSPFQDLRVEEGDDEAPHNVRLALRKTRVKREKGGCQHPLLNFIP